MEPQLEVSDLIVKSIAESIATVQALFGLEKPADTAPFTTVIAACSTLQGEAHDEVIKPIVVGILDELGLDPVENAEDRVTVEAFADLIAKSIADATQLIYQQMQMQAQRQAQIQAQGQGRQLLS